MNAQNYLGNLSFLSLFASMIFYWVGILFDDFKMKRAQAVAPLSTAGSYSEGQAGEVMYAAEAKGRLLTAPATGFLKFGRYGIILSNILLSLLLLVRWKESGHFPLSNLYESLMFLSWAFTTLHLFFFKENDSRLAFDSDSLQAGNKVSGSTMDFVLSDKFLGAITTPSALFTNAFATFTLPKEMQEAAPLVPALQSNWLMMHVTVMILSYAALILGSLLSLAFLIITFNENTLSNPAASTPSNAQVDSKGSKFTKKELAFLLDGLSYRILGIGFPFLTIGILSGAVWANEAWGSYWSWDPKETWALLTWLIFAIYLHTRLNKGWEGKKPAMIASFGFVVVWICYLGVNLIGEGLHSYGWLTN